MELAGKKAERGRQRQVAMQPLGDPGAAGMHAHQVGGAPARGERLGHRAAQRRVERFRIERDRARRAHRGAPAPFASSHWRSTIAAA